MQTKNPNTISIACFGAIRPLKNQLIQAVAAVRYAESIGKKLHFHINSNRLEGGSEPILKNLRGLFAGLPQHRLVEHPWLDWRPFTQLVRTMDIGMQVSMSETFNIVTADMVTNDVPVVVSPEISWVAPTFQVSPTNAAEIAKGLKRAYSARRRFPRHRPSFKRLKEYDRDSVSAWREIIAL